MSENLIEKGLNMDFDADLNVETIKVQAQILVPLAKLLQKELGEERANQLLTQALSPWTRAIGKMLREELSGSSTIDKLRAAVEGMGDANDQVTVFLPSEENELNYNITHCGFANFYRSLGLGELGFLFVCSLDDAIMPNFDSNLIFTRTQTIMQGASHCDFRFRCEPSSLRD